jgi:O-succinylbenzoate synthase
LKLIVGLDDLLSGDNFHSDQIKLEYEAWKEIYPDQEFSQEEYQIAAANTHAW